MARSFTAISSDKIVVGNVAPLSTLSGAFTISSWINFTSFPTSSNLMCISGFGYDGVNSHGNLDVYNHPINGLTLRFACNTTTADWIFGANITLGVWGNAVGVANGVNSLKLYYGGINNGSATGAGAAASSVKFEIGSFDLNGTDSRFLNGAVGDVALWNVVLSDGEIGALAIGARPHAIRRSSLIGYWPLDGIQSPEPDISGNKNNGTLTGTALASGPPISLFTPRRISDLNPVVSAGIFGYTNSPMGSIRRIPNIIGY